MKQRIKIFLTRLRLFLYGFGLIANNDRENQILLALKYRKLDAPPSFMDIGFNVFSPAYEDGILHWIFSRIGTTNRQLVDIGAGTYKLSSVTNLIINQNFSGLLIDGDEKEVEHSKHFYFHHLETRVHPPKIICEFVTTENINNILDKNGYEGEIDLLCIDIDGIDYWLLQAITKISPRVIVVEYNNLLEPDLSWTIPYDENFNSSNYSVNKNWMSYCGASLKAFVRLCKEKGYRLVGINKGGFNAFFVKNSIQDSFLPEVSIKSCFNNEINQKIFRERYPLVKNMDWVEV